MNKTNPSEAYPDFDYTPEMIKKFISNDDVFTIQLINGNLVNPSVKNPQLFKQWLLDNDIEDIK